jgi:hypothetical protein
VFPEGSGGSTIFYHYDEASQTWDDSEGGVAHSTYQGVVYLRSLQEQASDEDCIDRMQNPDGSWTVMLPGLQNPIGF